MTQITDKRKGKEKKMKNEIELSFYKKRTCWYAEVPEHTEAQNQMVSGADVMCEIMAAGHRRVTVNAVAHLGDGQKTIVSLHKVEQSQYGATYEISGADGLGLPDRCWLCNVTRTVFGGTHPDEIHVISIVPNDDAPYGGNPPKAV